MKVKANVSFTARVNEGAIHVEQGEIFELPDGVDWLNAGLVAAFKDPVERAIVIPAERAVAPPAEEPEPEPETLTRSEVINLLGDHEWVNNLIAAGFASLSALDSASDEELLDVEGVGEARVEDIREALGE